MYVIIVGAGDIGTPLIELATRDGNEVVVVEHDDERAEYASREFDCLVINDDATVRATLEDARADRADALLTTTDKDATNVMVCLLAKELEIPDIVSVVHDPEHMSLYRQIGVNTMENPQRLIAQYLYRGVQRPAIIDFMELGGDAEVFEIAVAEGAPIAGLTLRNAADEGILTPDMLVVAVERDGEETPITPRGGTRIEAGDVVTVYSATGATPEKTDIFGHLEDHRT
ncbi:potassium channel family protein [Haloarcula salina]|uniref:TrkA family potassium uptake protein n=1 Tax=Haloarcula salina TaxID=1429914 RepID=A0AA41G207_9EURY|nr:TrkA family potassium uptake protein [Haloarcula salina]MBV0902796.1 TrkA family potassium uptake protein [Haloarcula salina]